MNRLYLLFFLVNMIFINYALASNPDGLCIIELRSGENIGYAHGFISEGYLHSSAHVFELGLHRVFCIQGERLVEVTTDLLGNVEYNPNYIFTQDALLSSLNAINDYARIKYTGDLNSRFKIDEFQTAGAKVENDDARGIGENPWYRSTISLDLSTLSSDLTNFDINTFFRGSQIEQLKEDVVPVSFERPPQGVAEGMLFATTDGWETKSSVLFLDDTLYTAKGHSGSPLFQMLADGTLLVSGVASTVGHFLDALENKSQAVYTLSMNFAVETSPHPSQISNQSLDLTCKGLLN